MLRMRTLPAGFIEPCLPTKAETLPSGGLWLHEIKHDGFRIIARKDGARVRLYSRPGNNLALPLRPLARLAQDEEPGRASGEARGGERLGPMRHSLA
jgi:ATP-dependent DNA ligase